MSKKKKVFGLRRELGIFQVTIAGVGIILGAGIYALLGVAAGTSGNATWLAFLISALIALFTGLSYAELSSIFKGDSGEYDYIKYALSKWYAFLIGLSMIAAGFISAAAVALGFAGYFTQLVSMPLIVVALLLVILMTLINFVGIKETSWFNTVSTFIEFGGLVIIIFLGLKNFGSVNYFDMPQGITGVFSSAALVFFAYMGFESIVKLGEETKDPAKVIPRSLLYSVVITAVLYVLVALAAVSIIGWEELNASSAPLATVAAAVLGSKAFILLGIIALFSTSNTVLITMVATSRLAYGMAKEKSLPKFLSLVHERTRTPWAAILIIMLLTFLFTVIGDIEIVANLTNLFLFITFASVNLSMIVLRYKLKDRKRSFRCPVNIGNFPVIPLLGFLSSLGMLVFVLFNLF
ncbi:amino acid permease [Candidatus Woesearchaeota archaeon]|nr:amino acid permease [Candidatus Woesearchaeota archaeon]